MIVANGNRQQPAVVIGDHTALQDGSISHHNCQQLHGSDATTQDLPSNNSHAVPNQLPATEPPAPRAEQETCSLTVVIA